jgi:hypothetical protein
MHIDRRHPRSPDLAAKAWTRFVAWRCTERFMR